MPGKFAAKSVVEVATRVAMGQPFEAVYFLGARTPTFCVKVYSVNAALIILQCVSRWHSSGGLRFIQYVI
jgi:hypothetical protein